MDTCELDVGGRCRRHVPLGSPPRDLFPDLDHDVWIQEGRSKPRRQALNVQFGEAAEWPQEPALEPAESKVAIEWQGLKLSRSRALAGKPPHLLVRQEVVTPPRLVKGHS